MLVLMLMGMGRRNDYQRCYRLGGGICRVVKRIPLDGTSSCKIGKKVLHSRGQTIRTMQQ